MKLRFTLICLGLLSACGNVSPDVEKDSVRSDSLSESSADACNGLTWEGRCDGNTLSYCGDDTPITIHCADYGRTCGWNQLGQYYDCI